MLCEGDEASCQWFDDPLTLLEDASCVVPENIPPPPEREIEILGGGVVQKEAISKGLGVASQNLFSGAPGKIGKLFKTDS